jgi:hypothetical protein
MMRIFRSSTVLRRSGFQLGLLGLAVTLSGMSECNPREACLEQFETAPRQEACFQGAHDVYAEVTDSGASLPLTAEEARQACALGCRSRYESFDLSTDSPEELGAIAAVATELEEVCTSTCSARIETERSLREARAATPCEWVEMGGVFRCL